MNNHKDVIETNRLILRKLTISDAEEMFFGWCSDSEVTKYVTWEPHNNVEETRSLLEMWIKEYENPNTHRYGIALKDSGKLIGAIDVVEYEDNNPVIGYTLSRHYWNNGYMTEACKAFMEYLFSLGYRRILIEADSRNIGSNRVIEKCGFKLTHQEKRQLSEVKQEMITVNCYEIESSK